ncbi:hypothetical protein FEM48_Zijuj02G0158500 [Ziziphus jujuba var. spinosa]|uniref:F-box domain-containing protein n=1 Tax=Ziziphus jujuba var. spinosa TaxID=714518 RepID=A0A978VWK5_ZIZJJ|nr:uncharacterized protein LOC107412260 isoform X2 [Ziziphus jujuba var. spinosa]KAH7543200.1 hypothetical protein FEM48_Zijuj02G0158500 [Ziziphus jujuba var. spinosa]
MFKGKKRVKPSSTVQPNNCMLERLTLEGKKSKKLNEEEDRLPGEILESIMHCLKMKEAAKMGLVSKRHSSLEIAPRLAFNVDRISDLERPWRYRDLVNKKMKCSE